MKFFFHPDTESELEEAVAYYEECQRGLGMEFVEEVYATISRIVRFPYAWSEMSKKYASLPD